MSRDQTFRIEVVGFIVSILFAGNVYFIKRLVDKIDSTEQMVVELRIQVAQLQRELQDKTNCKNENPKRR